jgi:OOP family OmpA-OmpF porin
MKFVQRFLSLMLVLIVAACAGAASNSTVDALNKAQAVGSPFTKSLTVEYRAYSNEQQKKQMDHADALHFARKGMASASGVVVMPETLDDWDLSDKNLTEMSPARAALVDALENGGREVAPEKAAIAQAKFDCWAEQQEEKWNADVACKSAFFAALKELQNAVGTQPVAVVPAEEITLAPVESFPAPVSAMPNGEQSPIDQAIFIVFFDWDQSSITSSGNDVLDAVANEIKSRKDLKAVNIVGHTDTSGSAKYNQRLSLRRAESVKSSLVARGVSADILKTEGRGKNELMVKTANNVREPANRRAQITLE